MLNRALEAAMSKPACEAPAPLARAAEGHDWRFDIVEQLERMAAHGIVPRPLRGTVKGLKT
jgi:hypothetical protein